MSTMNSHNLEHSAKAFPQRGSGEGAWKGFLLIAALLCLPLGLLAGKRDYMKDPKYLLGAVPEIDGVVTFQKSFSVTDKSEKEIYDIMYAYINNTIMANAVQKKQPQYTRIISEDKESGTIVARIEEYMIFHKLPLSLDRTRFRYLLVAGVVDQKISLVTTQISYYYNEDMDGNNGVNYKAEEWITDKEAVNKKGTKLYPRSGKFRRKTVDRVEEIFKGFMENFSTIKGVVED